MKVTIAGGSGPQSVDLVFTPQVILRDRLLPTQEYRTPLRDVFQAVDGMPTGMFVWDLKSDGLRLDRARTLRFAWRAEGNLDGQPFSVEADLFEPLPAKTIVPVPYSETSAKLAIVAFVDRRPPSGSPEPLLQRTAMFGDSASPERGKPAIHGRTNEETFAYESRDSARFDVPVPLVASGQVVVSPLVVKYLVNGQVLAAAPDGSG